MNWRAFDHSIASAQQRIPGWRSITLRLPAAGKSPIVLTVDEGKGGRPDLRTQLTGDSSSGAITKSEDFASYNRGRQLRFWARFVHTGEAGGWAGQTLASLASIGGAVLVWTGFSLSWRRFFKKTFRSENDGVVHLVEGSHVKMQ